MVKISNFMNWENWKTLIFYGFLILWVAWGIVNYFFDYPIQLFLCLLILGVLGWVVIIWVGIVFLGKKKCVDAGGKCSN